MNLFVDAHVFDDLSQGSRTYLKGLYQEAIRMAPGDTFIFGADNAASVTRELGTHSNLLHAKYSSHNRFVRLGLDIPNLIRRHHAEWAHFQYISPLKKVCPEIVTIHDILFLDYPEFFPLSYKVSKGVLFKRSARRADWILTVSAFSKAAIIRHYGIPEEKIVITPNGILEYFWQPGIPSSDIASRYRLEKFVLFVSRFEPRKNHAGLLKAYVDLGLYKQGIQLVLVGEKAIPSNSFERLYGSLPEETKQKIVFTGDVSPADLKWLYGNCALFVYPSFAEGFGIPPIEAIACGANVICSNATAMSEFSFLGERLFNPNDSKALTNKLEHYLKHSDSADRDSIRQHCQQNYSWDLSATRFLKLFK